MNNELKYTPGKRVWFCKNPHHTFNNPPNTFGKVHHSFIGADNQEHVIVEVEYRTGKYHYHCLHWHRIHDSKNGKSNYEKLSNEAKAAHTKSIMVDAGIIHADGELTEKYGGPKRGGKGANQYTIINGTKYYDTDDIK